MLDTLSDDAELIAPCGMNCSVCSRYLARKYDVNRKGLSMPYCAGYRPRDKKCAFQKRCDLLRNDKVRFCYECSSFPCGNVERIDARYQKHYRRVSSKISLLSSSIRLPLLWNVRMRSGGVCSVEQCCAATTGSVTIAALIAYKRRRSCTGGTTNNEVDPT
ncbi:MAG: DUF3795 domain-containing protein [Halobacteriota archaeon]